MDHYIILFILNVSSWKVWFEFLPSVIIFNIIMSLLYKYDGINFIEFNEYCHLRFTITLFICIIFFINNPLLNWTIFEKLIQPIGCFIVFYLCYKFRFI